MEQSSGATYFNLSTLFGIRFYFMIPNVSQKEKYFGANDFHHFMLFKLCDKNDEDSEFNYYFAAATAAAAIVVVIVLVEEFKSK